MDILLLVITILLTLIIFGVSFYLLVIYIHPDEKGIGNSIPAKIVVVLGLGLSWGQLLLVPLDVSNTLADGGIDMPTFYTIVYIIVLVYLLGLSPFTMFFYESDEQDSLCSRITWSFVFTFIIAGIGCAAIFVSQIWLSVYAPGETTTTTMYIMLCLSFFGYFLLAVFGGIGLIALPVDFIKDFTERPKVLKPDEAKKKKEDIEQSSTKLVEMGEKLKQEEALLAKSEGWWATRKQTNKVNKLFDKFKENVIGLEQKYETFQAQLKIQEQNPILPYLSLVVGVLCCIFSLVWIMQLLFDVVLRPNGKPVWSVLNGLFETFNQKGLNFMSTGFFGVMTIFLLWCTQKGNISVGFRIPFVMSFHPMKKNETFLNSFLFNVNMMILASVATTQLSVFAFQSYTSTCYIGNVFYTQVAFLPFFGFIFEKRIFPIAMVGVMLLYSLYAIIAAVLRSRKAKKAEEAAR